MVNYLLRLRHRDDDYIVRNDEEFMRFDFRDVLVQYFLDVIENEELEDFILNTNYHIGSARELPNANRLLIMFTLPDGELADAFNCNNFTARANGGLLDEFFIPRGLHNYEVLNCEVQIEGGKSKSSKKSKKKSNKRRSKGRKRRSSYRRRF